MEPLTLPELVGFCSDILSGLVYLHSLRPHPAIHRDLKPDNILVFLSPGGLPVLKISDVGLTRFTNAGGLLTHTFGGSPFYLAPEASKSGFDARVDVFSFGIMTAEMVLAYLPVPGFAPVPSPTTVYGVAGRLAMATEAAARVGTVSPKLARLITGCCEEAPERRFTSDTAFSLLRSAEEVDGAAAAGSPGPAAVPVPTGPSYYDATAVLEAMEALGLTAHLEAFADSIDDDVTIPSDRLKPLLTAAGVSAVNVVKVRGKLTAPSPTASQAASSRPGLSRVAAEAAQVFMLTWRLVCGRLRNESGQRSKPAMPRSWRE